MFYHQITTREDAEEYCDAVRQWIHDTPEAFGHLAIGSRAPRALYICVNSVDGLPDYIRKGFVSWWCEPVPYSHFAYVDMEAIDVNGHPAHVDQWLVKTA